MPRVWRKYQIKYLEQTDNQGTTKEEKFNDTTTRNTQPE